MMRRVQKIMPEGSRFDEFWKLYPSRNGVRTGKAVARKAWMKLKGDDALFELILKALMWNLHSNDDWLKDNGQFIPMGSTWLNQKRWEDLEDAGYVVDTRVDPVDQAEVDAVETPNIQRMPRSLQHTLSLREKYIQFRGIKVGV